MEDLGIAGYEPSEVDRRIDFSGYVVLPGFINTHHHLFQTLFRGVPGVEASESIFDWLRAMYMLMSEVTDEDLYISSIIGNAELLLSGCTTNSEHHYFIANDVKYDTCIKAAQDVGIRFHLARGSFSRGESDGALPPDHIVEKEDFYLEDA